MQCHSEISPPLFQQKKLKFVSLREVITFFSSTMKLIHLFLILGLFTQGIFAAENQIRSLKGKGTTTTKRAVT